MGMNGKLRGDSKEDGGKMETAHAGLARSEHYFYLLYGYISGHNSDLFILEAKKTQRQCM